jgi:hypothetical protein
MRFTLGLISAVILANMVNAAPATNTQANMGIDAEDFQAEQVSQLELKEN